MVVIAVAGGTGDVGRAVVEEIARTGKHKVLVLGRQVRDNPFPPAYPFYRLQP